MKTWQIVALLAVAAGAIYFFMKKRHPPMLGGKAAAPIQQVAKSKPKSRWRRALGGAANLAKAGASMYPGGAQALSIGSSLGVV